MELHLLPLLIPVLLVLVFLEWKHEQSHHSESGEKNYDYKSTLTNISFGIIERVFDVFFFVGLIYVFNTIADKVGLLNVGMHNVWGWISCFILLDFIIYWFHRSGHQINLLWGAHVTHHSCEEFNLTVAFRNSIFPHIFRSIYMLILPILGFPGEMIIICLTVSGIWQFGIHTKRIDKLGWLEYFMMTPSHHRVHHGRNPEYIDKNFGGFFIIWDRLFGTFQEEKARVDFGIKAKIDFNNPLESMTHVWKDIWTVASRKRTFLQKLGLWFQTPESFYKVYGNELEEDPTNTSERVASKFNYALVKYQSIHFILLGAFLLFFLVYMDYLSSFEKLASIVFIVSSAIILPMLHLDKSWLQKGEEYRLFSMIFLPLLLQSYLLFLIGGIVLLCSWRRSLENKSMRIRHGRHMSQAFS